MSAREHSSPSWICPGVDRCVGSAVISGGTISSGDRLRKRVHPDLPTLQGLVAAYAKIDPDLQITVDATGSEAVSPRQS